jgi:hypothetical protein
MPRAVEARENPADARLDSLEFFSQSCDIGTTMGENRAAPSRRRKATGTNGRGRLALALEVIAGISATRRYLCCELGQVECRK